jgi:hypothetical protein
VVIPVSEAGRLRVTHPFATLPPRRIQEFPFDLHVLGTPPAFILSQDQTLHSFFSMTLAIVVFDGSPSLTTSYHSSVVKVPLDKRSMLPHHLALVKTPEALLSRFSSPFEHLPLVSALRGRQTLFYHKCKGLARKNLWQ